jgi:hypothetical protein
VKISGNAEGAKGPSSRAAIMSQPSDGEERVVNAKPFEMYCQWLDCKSRMRRESHVRFRESGGVQFPSATRLPQRCSAALH